MSNSEEDSYSTIFTSLKHPIRRRLLRILSDEPQSFSDMQKQFKIESSHLTYHIESLRNLLYKTEDGKYALSSFGEAAVSMMRNVEEPPKDSLHLPDHLSHRIRILNILTLILVFSLAASLVLNAVFVLRYNDLDNAYSELMQISEKGFRMYSLEDNALLISDVDILSYNWTSQEIILTHGASERLVEMDDNLYNWTGFVIKIDGEEVYRGVFRSPHMSAIPAPPRISILFPSILFPSGLEDYESMKMFYPNYVPLNNYPQSNAIIFQHFEKMGILVY